MTSVVPTPLGRDEPDTRSDGGRLDPLRRLEALFDGVPELLPADDNPRPLAVIAATGRARGRTLVAYAYDARISGGAIGRLEADVVVRALRLARQRRAPVVGFLESAGARLQDGAAALGGLARVFSEHVALSGHVPQISVMTGTAAGGGCYSPALTDFVVMTRAAAMFLTGPKAVRAAVGEDVDASTLGGPRVHERNGVCQLVVSDDAEAVAVARQLLAYLAANESQVPSVPAAGPSRSARARIGAPCPRRAGGHPRPRRRWDLSRGGPTLGPRNRVRARGAAPVGVVANQPRHLGGVLDVHASDKGARFVRTCNACGAPLVVLVDTPGFLPRVCQEAARIIRHGAELVRAFAGARVPSVTVILRKAFGGAYISLNARDLGADAVFAWKGAEIGIMGGVAAVAVLDRIELAAAPESQGVAERLAEDYRSRKITVGRALEAGVLDRVIPARDTRGRHRLGPPRGGHAHRRCARRSTMLTCGRRPGTLATGPEADSRHGVSQPSHIMADALYGESGPRRSGVPVTSPVATGKRSHINPACERRGFARPLYMCGRASMCERCVRHRRNGRTVACGYWRQRRWRQRRGPTVRPR